MNTHYLTQAKLEELKKELETLKKDKRQEIAERLKTAKDYGDLSENSEYAEAREEQAVVEQRIFQLEDMLKDTSIIETGGDANKVRVGSVVKIKKDDKVFSYSIVGANETMPEEGKISNESPLGQALIGHSTGESVSIKTPAGEFVYKIISIE